MSWEEYKYWFSYTYENMGCSGPMFAMIAFMLFALCGCATKKSTESTIDYSRMERISEKMDSLMHSTKEWQQSIFEKQTSLVDSFKQSEVRDTSHTVFLGAKGDTIKEKIIIREYIEREHTSKESEKEYYQEMYKRTDSLLQVTNSKVEKMDSVLSSHEKNTMVEKQPSIFDKLKYIGGGFVIGVIGLFACATAFMRKR